MFMLLTWSVPEEKNRNRKRKSVVNDTTKVSFTTTFVDVVIVGVLKQNIYSCLYSYSSWCGQPLSIAQLNECTLSVKDCIFFFKLLLVCFH